MSVVASVCFLFFFQAEDGIRDLTVTGVQTCALPIWRTDRGPGASACPRGSSRAARACPSLGRQPESRERRQKIRYIPLHVVQDEPRRDDREVRVLGLEASPHVFREAVLLEDRAVAAGVVADADAHGLGDHRPALRFLRTPHGLHEHIRIRILDPLLLGAVHLGFLARFEDGVVHLHRSEGVMLYGDDMHLFRESQETIKDVLVVLVLLRDFRRNRNRGVDFVAYHRITSESGCWPSVSSDAYVSSLAGSRMPLTLTVLCRLSR